MPPKRSAPPVTTPLDANQQQTWPLTFSNSAPPNWDGSMVLSYVRDASGNVQSVSARFPTAVPVVTVAKTNDGAPAPVVAPLPAPPPTSLPAPDDDALEDDVDFALE